jgi:hypothetical protein
MLRLVKYSTLADHNARRLGVALGEAIKRSLVQAPPGEAGGVTEKTVGLVGTSAVVPSSTPPSPITTPDTTPEE